MDDILFLDNINHYTHMPAVLGHLLRLKDHVVTIKPEDITPAHAPEVVELVKAGKGVPQEIADMVNSGTFYSASEKAGQIAALARPEQFALVIVGNNMGEGVVLVRMLNPDLRSRTIIMAFEPMTPEKEAPYRELGCTRFMVRDDLDTTLASLNPA